MSRAYLYVCYSFLRPFLPCSTVNGNLRRSCPISIKLSGKFGKDLRSICLGRSDRGIRYSSWERVQLLIADIFSPVSVVRKWTEFTLGKIWRPPSNSASNTFFFKSQRIFEMILKLMTTFWKMLIGMNEKIAWVSLALKYSPASCLVFTFLMRKYCDRVKLSLKAS